MLRFSPLLFALLIIVSACTTGDDQSSTPGPATSSTGALQTPLGDRIPADGTVAAVVRVDDGDTLVVEIGGDEQQVRLIGINAPESGECVGDLAKSALTEIIGGREVLIEADVEGTDQYGRLLRYVWIDGALINETLARDGLAQARAFEPNTARQSQIDAAGDQARLDEIGIWNPEACGPGTGASIELLTISANPPGRDEDNLTGEYVVLVNTGRLSMEMGGFILRDGSSTNRYTFPKDFVAEPSVPFAVVVGCGVDTTQSLYWCSDGPVWNNAGDEIFLTDLNGNLVLFESYQDEG